MRVTTDYDNEVAYAENIDTVLGLGGTRNDISLSANGRLTDPSPDEGGQATLTGDFVDVPESGLIDGKIPTGSHVSVAGLDMTIDRMLNLRSVVGDDATRLELDQLRHNRGSPHLQLLFDRKYIDRFETPSDDTLVDPWHSGKASDVVAGTLIVPDDEVVKDPDSGRLDYQKLTELLIEEFGSGAALWRQIESRSNVDISTRPSARASDVKLGRRDPTRAEKKALRDYAEDRNIGHYDAGRAAMDWVAEGEIDAVRRRSIVEYVDVVWDNERSDSGNDDYFRELNITTSCLNRNVPNSVLKFTHNDVAEHAVKRLSPTRDGNTLTHRRARANEVPQADGVPATDGATRGTDSMNWESRLLDRDEAEAYRDNLGNAGEEGATLAQIGRADDYPVFEVVLYDEDHDDMIWHVLGIDDGDGLRNATIIVDSNDWW